VLKRQPVVLEVVIIFSSRSKKLLRDDQDMVAFTGKRKTRLALYFNQFYEKRHCNRNTEWINTKEKELTGTVQ